MIHQNSFMKTILLFFLSIFFLSCAQTKIYMVRHAEKTGNTPNADLKSPEGFARANTLKDSMKNMKLAGVFSTNVPRTLHTGQPSADDHMLPVTVYANGDSLVDQLILKKKKRFLVVGHSNTVPQMIRHLGLDPGFTGDIPDNDFDNLYVITVTWEHNGRRMSVVRKTYGVVSP